MLPDGGRQLPAVRFNRDYLTLITAGVLMAAIANTAMPQIFALAREYADSEAREVVMFSSVMRAQLSLAR